MIIKLQPFIATVQQPYRKSITITGILKFMQTTAVRGLLGHYSHKMQPIIICGWQKKQDDD
jgi:hypothetical protein